MIVRFGTKERYTSLCSWLEYDFLGKFPRSIWQQNRFLLEQSMSLQTIQPIDLSNAIKNGHPVNVVDVRTPVEFREAHLGCAKNMPLDRLDIKAIASNRGGSGDPLYVICRSGGRGKQACEALLSAGQTNIFNVEGGTLAWEQAGLPLVRGRKAISLERQVRVAAGAIVFTGAVLGYLLHPYWIGLSAFVGTGLVFSGVTDTCTMGLLLAKMPWNRV